MEARFSPILQAAGIAIAAEHSIPSMEVRADNIAEAPEQPKEVGKGGASIEKVIATPETPAELTKQVGKNCQ